MKRRFDCVLNWFTVLLNRISESLCEVEGDYIDHDEGGGEDAARCDTRATNEIETISITSVGEVSLIIYKLMANMFFISLAVAVFKASQFIKPQYK